MIKTTNLLAGLALPLLLIACSGSDKATTDNSKPLAMVNGKAITQKFFDVYLKQRRDTAPGQAENTQQVIEELINFELLSQDAVKMNIHREEEVVTQLALQRNNILASAAYRAYIRDNPITEEAMQKDYESRMERLKLKEYKLRHTLNEKEDDAKAIVAALDKGESFADVAKKLSAGPSAKEGGDLGWLGSQDMVPGFREAAILLEKGKYTSPVKTQYGWHVIYLEDQRETPPPEFAQVRKQVKSIMQRRQIEDYIKNLRETAKIEILSDNFPKPPVSSDKAADPNPGSPLKSEINLDNRY